MVLQSSSSHETTSWRILGTALLIAALIVAVMLIATAVLGIAVNGPSYDIVPDPAGFLGLPF